MKGRLPVFSHTTKEADIRLLLLLNSYEGGDSLSCGSTILITIIKKLCVQSVFKLLKRNKEK